MSKQKKRAMSVGQIRRIAAKKLEDDIQQRVATAVLEGAMQGIAFVMYTLEQNRGWKQVRQQGLFDDMMAVMEAYSGWFRPVDGRSIVEHIRGMYDIDFDKLFSNVASKVE